LRRSSQAVCCFDEGSEDVSGFVRKMHDMRNMQISVCLCGEMTCA
jgi:hypothetical protein